MEVCPICCDRIAEATETSEGEEALQCDGACQKWIHRWCAGVHKDHYAVLASSDKPFLCPSCCLSEHRQLIMSLLDTVESLKNEIRQLKEAKEAGDESVRSESPTTQTPAPEEEPHSAPGSRGSTQEWVTVTGKGRREKGASRKGKEKATNSSSNPAPSTKQKRKTSEQTRHSPRWLNVKSLTTAQLPDQGQSSSAVQNLESAREPKSVPPETEEVDGVRRVWGTMRGCSSGTILTTLQKLSTVAERVEVRRKFKKRKNNTTQWWFLIRGEEQVLQKLEQEWERVQTQTSWKLERCHRPIDSNGEQVTGGKSSFLDVK